MGFDLDTVRALPVVFSIPSMSKYYHKIKSNTVADLEAALLTQRNESKKKIRKID